MPALTVRAWPPSTSAVKVTGTLATAVVMLTAAPDRVTWSVPAALPKVMAREAVNVSPSSIAFPRKLLSVLPPASVTSPSKRTFVPSANARPFVPATVFWKRTSPVWPVATVIAAPTPLPRAVTAPVKLTVPAPTDAAMTRSLLPPA